MNKKYLIRLGLLMTAAVATAVVYFLPSGTPAQKAAAASTRQSELAAPIAQVPIVNSSEVKSRELAARDVIGSGWSANAPREFAAFRDWTLRRAAASPAERNALRAEGIQLATERRAALLALIPRDPRAALENAVPMVVRQQLPPEITALLETRLSGRGSLSVLGVTAPPGATVAEPVFRSADIGGERYHTYVYGRRATQSTLSATSITGIAVNKIAAVSESPLRVLEAGEEADGRPVDNVCGVSGLSTAIKAGAGFNVTAPSAQIDPATAVEYNGKIQVLCHAEHVNALETKLIAAEGDQPTTSNEGPPTATYSWTHGTKKVLIIRIDFSDKPGAPMAGATAVTPDVAVNMFNNANGARDFYEKCSYGQTSLSVDPVVAGASPSVTPVLRMPQTAAWYQTNDSDAIQMLFDAYAVAKTAGYDYSKFDRPGIVFSSLGFPFSGQAYIGSTGFWLQGGGYSVGVACHEIGHNYGLYHANLWRVTDGNTISAAGSSLEYGDSFDTMGNAGSVGEFSHWAKLILQWMPESSITVARAAGTFRIYRFDGGLTTNQANVRALKIYRNPTTNYWVGYRRTSGNASLNGGAYILWGLSGHPEGQLLDMQTPGNNTADAGLPIGTTFTDPVAGLGIKPLSQGGSGADEYLDVQVTFQPRLQWSQAAFAGDAQRGVAILKVSRLLNGTGAVSVNFATSSGTAVSPTDFTAQSGTLNWADGDLADKTITVALVPHAAAGGTKNFTVTLSSPTGGAVVGNNAAATVSAIDAGVRDPSFNSYYYSGSLRKVLPLPDGSMIVGGVFPYIYPSANVTQVIRNSITRVLVDGTMDTTFASDGGITNVSNYAVNDLALQPDGKILVGGQFTGFNGFAGKNNLVRLLADGSLDSTFNAGTGTNGIVYSVVVQPNGKIIVGGAFTSFNGTAREYLARLNSDGSLDTSFVGPYFQGTTGGKVTSLALQADGKVVVAGSFADATGVVLNLCRVTPTGAVDAAFNGLTTGTNAVINKVVLQPDGKILIGGAFTSVNGTSRGGLARLTTTGAVDVTFVPPATNGTVNALCVEPDGSILIGAGITPPHRLAHYSSTGTLDTTFNLAGEVAGDISDLALLPNGRAVFAGGYGAFQGGSYSTYIWEVATGLTALPSTVQFSTLSVSGNQGTSVNVSVARTGGSSGALVVGYSTVPSSAHFAPTSGVLNWANGDTGSKIISVPLTYGFLSGATESCTVNLGQPVLGGTSLGAAQQALITINPSPAPPAVTGDMNGDGMADILWENTTTGDRGFWTMNGTGFTSWIDVGIISPDLRIVGTADFNGDGKMDILWENTVTGKRVIWFMNGTTFVSSLSLGVVSTDWRIAVVADFNNDGKPDILWENTLSGDRCFWMMNGSTFSYFVDIGIVTTDWHIAAAGDFNHDNKPDILWENTVTGDRCFWLMDGTAFSSWVDIGIVSTDWRIAGIGDYNSDNNPDILWENTVTGDRGFWLMNSTAFSSWVDIGIIGTDWRIGN